MLLKYGARNFFSFKEGIEISVELSSNCPKKISKGRPVSNLICVMGANASGKTNALKILSLMKDFCIDSFNQKPDEDIFVLSFFGNDDPVDMYCDFEINGIEYTYDASVTSKKVISESITRKKNRAVILFKREGNKIKEFINEFSELKKINLRSNASIISTANQYQIDGMQSIYNFFLGISSNVTWSGRSFFKDDDSKIISKYYKNNPTVLEFSTEIISKCDLGINNIEIYELKNEKGEEIFYPMFEHDVKAKNKKLTLYDQSSGTRELFHILPYYKRILSVGGVLVLDEFDINLHPHILPLLIKLFDDDEANPHNAQMVFTTNHDSIIDYMGKYRTIVINKEKSESYAYRLDEIPGDILRNDRPIAPIYNAGKIGGVPKV